MSHSHILTILLNQFPCVEEVFVEVQAARLQDGVKLEFVSKLIFILVLYNLCSCLILGFTWNKYFITQNKLTNSQSRGV